MNEASWVLFRVLYGFQDFGLGLIRGSDGLCRGLVA